MLLDQNAMMSDGQTVASSAASAHTVDLGAAGNAVPGALFVVCRAEEAFAGLTQLKVSLQTDDSAEFTDAEELLSATFALADLGEVKTYLPWPCPQARNATCARITPLPVPLRRANCPAS